VAVDIPYVFLQTVLYVAITYPTIGYDWSTYKVFWYFYATFCTLLYFVYLGMLIVSVSPNIKVASILVAAVSTVLNLFAGFLLPGPVNPSNSSSISGQIGY
jgi:NhaP-type Na+/H+ or K+/H+ antiporter